MNSLSDALAPGGWKVEPPARTETEPLVTGNLFHQRPLLAEQFPPDDGPGGETRDEAWATRETIRGLLFQYCRGIDRREWPTVLACFHEDAVDDHGGGVLRGPAEFVEWLGKRHLRTTSSFHVVMNTSFLRMRESEVRTESLCWARQRYACSEGERQLDIGCRYLDRFERRAGKWAIAHRKVVYEWVDDRESSNPCVPEGIADDMSRRDRSDALYAFLDSESPAPE
jgi:hypothetical protein